MTERFYNRVSEIRKYDCPMSLEKNSFAGLPIDPDIIRYNSGFLSFAAGYISGGLDF